MTSGQPNTGLDNALQALKSTILTSLDGKHQKLIEEWLTTYTDYLSRESTFNPLTETIKYEAGCIVSIELGYNPVSEHGGNHYAVVVEDNAKTSPVVMIVPLGSAKPGKDVHFNDVDLGEIPAINALSKYPPGTKSIAVLSQMRSISKIRINAPVQSGDQIIFVPVLKLGDLYNKIKTRFASRGLNRQTGKSTK